MTHLEQRKSFKRRQIFDLSSDGKLKVKLLTATSSREFSIPLDLFDAVPLRPKKFHWMPLLAVIPLLLLIMLIGAGVSYAFRQGTSPIGPAFFAIGLLALAVPFALKIVLGSYDILTFQSSKGHRIALWFEKPSKEEFDHFVKTLKSAILAANRGNGVESQIMSAELQRLKQLFDNGIIDTKQFEAAKNKVVGLDDRGSIGF